MNTSRHISLSRLRQATLLIVMIMMCGVGEVMGAITPTKPANGDGTAVSPYQISTAAELWGFAAIVNGTNGFTQNLSAYAVLADDIDMGGEANGSFPGIGVGTASPYQGTFDGQGHSITNFYQLTSTAARTGLFNYIKGTGSSSKATVRNFKISGEKVYPTTSGQAMHGTVAGEVEAYALLEDVQSSVTFTSNKAFAIQGGIAGCVNKNGVINRCIYSGTMNCGAAIDRIGGIVGEIRGGTVSNCLFNGTIKNNNSNIKLGGIAGATGSNDGSKIENSFSHGTITLVAGAGANVGTVLGIAGKTITITNTYYTTTNATNLSNPVGSGTSATATNVTGSPDITNGTLKNNLGQFNWRQDATLGYPVPGETKHEHKYGATGICSETVGDCDAHYQSVEAQDGVYNIANGGQLLWWANQVNQGKINKLSYVTLTGDCNIAGETWPEISGYQGTFDGQGHTISGYSCTNSATVTSGVGFFYNTSNATLKRFTLKGTFNITGSANNSAFMGGVVGKAVNTTIEDVTSTIAITTESTVNGTQNSGIRLVGGLVGDANGCTINRCRYKGTMTLDASTAAIGDRFGGIVGSVQTGVTKISNCLFDGAFVLNKNSIILGGILGRKLSGTLTIENCLSVGTFSLKTISTTCGKLIGQSNTETISKCYYTNSGFTVNGSPVSSGFNTYGTLTDGSNWKSVTTTLNGENLNWKIISGGAAYPIPYYSPVHEHTYATNNGVCTVTGCEQQLQPASIAADGYYEIGNTGQLLWFGKGINDGSVAPTSNARMTASIQDYDMPLPEFSGIGTAEHPFAGIFDGQNYAVKSSFTTTSGTGAVGMFAYLEGTAEHTATIKDLELEGTFNVSAAREGIGALVGYMGDYTLVDNVHSHVDINVTNADAKYIGGIIGIMEEKAAEKTEVNLVCYHNTIDVTQSAGPIGGIVGDMRGGTIENALFDGTIETANTTNDLVIGGIAGQDYKASGNNKPAYIKNSLSHGTITATGSTSQKLGSIMGRTNQNVTSGGGQDASYYVNNGVTKVFGEKASHAYDTFTDASGMTKEALRTALGETNWALGEKDYPFPQRGGTHTHNYDAFGFCCANDNAYEAATQEDGYYIIDNAGKLYWFASSINDGTIAADSKAKVQPTFGTSIDLQGSKWGVFPMIGNDTHKFTGEFDGQGNTIENIHLYTGNVGATKKGMFIATTGANIHDFTVRGTFYIANAPGDIHGGITGETNGANYEDINCAIDIQCLAETKSVAQVGGFAGLANGGSVINRCRFSGPMTVASGVASGKTGMEGDTHDAIGGMFGQSNNATITNCLFDGTITPASTNTALNVGGIIGYVEASTTMNNNFSHGTITLPSGTFTKCGAVVGRAAVAITTQASPRTNYFTTSKNTGVTTAVGTASTSTLAENTFLEASAASIYNEKGLVYKLGDANWYLESYTEGNYPTPKEGEHVHRYDNGFCVGGDGNYEEPVQNAENVFEIDNAGKLFWFANYVNQTGLGTGNGHGNASAKLTGDINLEGQAFPGIAKYTTYKNAENKDVLDVSYAYTGTFDGQGHSISGFVRNVPTGNQGGLFNYVNGATIKNFTLAGTMTVNGTGQQYGSVIGASEGETTLIEDIHSSVNVSITSTAAQIGGFSGRAGGTYNRCRYSGTVSTNTAYNKIGGFAGSHRGGTTSNCLFDGTLDVSTSHTDLIAGGFSSSVIELASNSIANCLVHGTVTIPNKTAKCGIVTGYVERTTTISQTYYTTENKTAELSAIGTITSTVTITGQANPKGDTSWDNILNSLNPATGNEGNWKIETGEGAAAYPIPCKVEDYAHVHNYVNGFCLAGDSYEEATRATDGWYEIANAGQLWWIAEKINDGTIAKTARIRLTADINMDGETHGQFTGICPLGTYKVNGNSADDWEGTAFQGIFDGKGHTISNYSRTISAGLTRKGLFNAVYNATIRDLNIGGSLTITGNGSEAVMIGVVVGDAAGTSVIEDINSSVNITVNNAIVRDLGGIAGALDDLQSKAVTTMNRCRYNGTITLTGTQNKAAKNVGGLVGELRSAFMKNCLYDGTITVGTGVTYESVGGVVGKVGTRDNSEMHRILSHGTITLPTGYVEATNKCGIVVGSADKTIYLYKNYHTTTNCSGLSYIGPHIIDKTATASDEGATVGSIIKVDQLLGTSTDKTSSVADLKTDAFRTLLGEPNWSYAESEYVYPFKDESHIHHYSNGFCTSGDGEYEKPNSMGKIYQIQNGGQLYWFAEHFNNKEIPQDAEVQILKDIDMEGSAYIYPGIGTSDYKFKGKFNGLSHSIGRFYRDIVNAEGTGLINYAEDATIEFFSLYGTMHYNLATIKNYHGTVVGLALGKNTLITDVYSFVDINIQNAYARVVGGIAGRTSGVLRRSRYSGVIAKTSTRTDGKIVTTSIEAMASGRQIGGLVANAREEILIEDCLFDGQIWSTCEEAPIMRVSGILASNEKNSGVKITIKNCLFNGCLKLNHTYTEPAGVSHELQTYYDANNKPYQDYDPNMKQTQNGIIAGYWDSNLPKVVNNVYHMNTCSENNDVPLGKFEGQNQTGTNTIVTTEIKAPKEGETSPIWDSEKNEPKWNEVFKALDEYKEVKNEDGTPKVDKDGNPVVERNGNWEYNYDPENPSTTEEIPTPGGHVCLHVKTDEEGKSVSAYNKFGYCEICGSARPLEDQLDTDGKYKMEVVSDLASFRDMVNNGDIKEGTVLNAKLTADIDFSEFSGDFGEPIGNSNFNRYLYNFDGQGHKLLNVKITTSDQYVGFFGFAGDDTHDCLIHDLTITGEIEVPYKSTDNDDKPMYMGVVGKMYRGKVYNVHSELTMRNTNATRAMIGGIVGCCETSEGEDSETHQPLAVIIDKCSYTGDCYINAAGNFGGILGQASRYTEVKNCTFAGNVHHTYQGSNNTTNFSGIVGYNGEATFKGVQNCVVAGVLNTDPGRTYSNYGTSGNHKNAVVGEDAILTAMLDSNYQPQDDSKLTEEQKTYRNQYSNNYAWNVYQSLVAENSSNIQTYVSQEKFINGEICAIMNGLDDNTESIQDGHPWGQILGYQKGSGKGGLGINDDGNIEAGAHTDGSPAQRVPLPGYKAVKTGEDKDGNDVYAKTAYKVTATVNASDASKKYDYTADWYYFDDLGDTTPVPSDAASLKVKKIQYEREASYLKNYNSFCLPFEFTQEMKGIIDTNASIYLYASVEDSKVKFQKVTEGSIAAGTPFILYCNSDVPWKYEVTNAEGTVVPLEPSVPKDGVGLYGSFNTKKTGTGYYKINTKGSKLVKTTESSDCFPYRVYLKLPAPTAAKYSTSVLSLMWLDEIFGDVNGDGKVNITDVATIISGMNGIARSLIGDVNNDGKIDKDDINIVIEIIQGLRK